MAIEIESPAQMEAAAVAGSVAAQLSLPAPAAPERRKSRRFLCEGTAKVMVLGGALSFTGKLHDLSLAGCCVVTEVAFVLERGTQAEILMVVNNTSFRVAGGVRSNHKVHGVGLEFMNLSTRSTRLIHDLIAELDAKQKREAAEQTA